MIVIPDSPEKTVPKTSMNAGRVLAEIKVFVLMESINTTAIVRNSFKVSTVMCRLITVNPIRAFMKFALTGQIILSLRNSVKNELQIACLIVKVR